MSRVRKAPTQPSAEYEARMKVSNENMRNQKRMIDEMEAAGLKVMRRDTFNSCGAVLITPQIVHMETTGDHGYYPNAVAELYEKWKATT